VILACDARVVRLLGTLHGVTAVPLGVELSPYDAWIDQMSLPLVFAAGPTTIPAAKGYLVSDPVCVAAWWAALRAGRKVGVAWAGNPDHSNDRRLSLLPDALAALLAAPGVHFVSLQLGPRAFEAGLPDLSARLGDYTEAARLIASLDLVVTADTPVAHFAGALGVPCWVMLPYVSDWRWQLRSDASAWYASMRPFRQPAPGAWCDVVGRVVVELGGWRDGWAYTDRRND
jgi:hypothetical protein